MADKFLKNLNGDLAEQEVIVSSSGVSSAGKIFGLDSTGKIDLTFMPVGIGANTSSILASENLAAGEFVNIYNNSGVANVRKADATTNGKEAHGFVLTNVTAGQNANVYFEGVNTQVTGAIPGPVFLSTAAGQFVSTAPTGSGNVVQKLGIAISATTINVEFGQKVILA